MMRQTVLGVLVAATLSGPAWAEKLSLDALSGYLNGLTQATSSFTQINEDGSIATGVISIKRPGKIRFEYNPPAQALVKASSGAIAIYDVKLGTPPERYPLNRTPLKLILARNVDLSDANMVIGHTYDGTATTVLAQDPRNPELGTIELVFTGDPVELRQWVVTDDAGSTTTIILGGMNTEVSLPNDLFAIETLD